MSAISDAYYDLHTLRQSVATLSASPAVPTSIIVPVASATLAEFTNDIFMDHDRLPPMQPFTIGSETVNGHDLNSEFMYVCMNQYASGTFHLLGESGLFSIGFSTLAINPTTPDFGVDVIHPSLGFSGNTLTLKGIEQRSVFLAKGDFFRVFCTLPQGAPNHTLDGMLSNFTITRLSRNEWLNHPVSFPT